MKKREIIPGTDFAKYPICPMIHDIENFHVKFGLKYGGEPRDLPDGLRELKEDHLTEELDEYKMAWCTEERLDALVDIVYVALGAAYLHGFDFEEAWRRVHAANMKKVRVQAAHESKRCSSFDIVKPDGWTAPDLGDLV